jgi:hypothetical protein
VDATCPTLSSPPYQPRSPEQTLLYEVLSTHFESFLERAVADGRSLPAFVVREVRAFLRCGIRAHGFTRVRCASCRHEYALPFSCKGRGFCPSCTGRHMAETAAHLVDHVLPDVPVRQWVLTLPFELRLAVAYDPDLCSAMLRLFASVLAQRYCDAARDRGILRPQCGGFTVTQRFGSDLRLNPHFHTATLDGVFSLGAEGSTPTFCPVEGPSDAEVADIVGRIHARALRLLRRRGLLPDEASGAEGTPSLDDSALAQCYAGAVRGCAAFGPHAGRPAHRLGRLLRDAPPEALGPRCARSHGFNLHANVTVAAGDRWALERLCRYLTRPPLSHERLERLDDEHVGLRLKTPYSDGTEMIALSHDELIERLCALVPRPRQHRVRYHGILAPAARFRRFVVPTPNEQDPSPPRAADPTASADPASASLRSKRRTIRRLLWAELLRRTFGVDPLLCPHCGGQMKMIASIHEADVVRAILQCHGLPTEAPFIRPSRGPPEADPLDGAGAPESLWEVWW